MTRLQDRIKNLPEDSWTELDDLVINAIEYLVGQANGSNFYDLEKPVLLWVHDEGKFLDPARIKNLLILLDVKNSAVEVILDVCFRINNGVRVRPPKRGDEFTERGKAYILSMNAREALNRAEQESEEITTQTTKETK